MNFEFETYKTSEALCRFCVGLVSCCCFFLTLFTKVKTKTFEKHNVWNSFKDESSVDVGLMNEHTIRHQQDMNARENKMMVLFDLDIKTRLQITTNNFVSLFFTVIICLATFSSRHYFSECMLRAQASNFDD